MEHHEHTIDALLGCYDELDALTGDLSEAEWDVQSLCPDWTVKGVVTHLAGVENLLIGWLPESAEDPPPFQQMAAFIAEAEPMSGPELAACSSTILAERRRELVGLSDEDLARPGMTPVGPGPYGRFMDVRVFDFWVHQRDMTIPLGRATDDSGPAAEIALDEVHRSMGYIVGKRIGLPDGMSIAFRLRGGMDRDIHVAVDGRAAVVDHLDDPDVVVHADTTTFVMLACGRVDPQAQIDAGLVRWEGADEWGDIAARSLRFTM